MITPEIVGTYTSVWGEGPLWDKNRLLYVDIETHKIISFNPVTGEEKIWDVGQRVGTVVAREQGGLLWAGDQGFFFLDEETGISTPIADPEPELADNRFNDGKCDPQGRLWAGTINLKKRQEASLYCLHTDLTVEKKFGPVTNSNGIIWSRDGATMFYIDTPRKKIRAFDFDGSTSAISNERVIWDTSADSSSPDGMTIDSEDRLWIAFCHGGKVVCFDPKTQAVVQQVDFPCVETTACAFGGPELRDLYVTTGVKGDLKEEAAGRLFVCRPGAQGVPSVAFAG
ncbi:SMP-30/gluconolactonase/LRE family protein [Prosthecobacter algae]|uniref:SMP-30/gluconolactonase/LRE family protein n=1 Tax=Prosthecobacter algae TaxID=1144682 RepID=A0ABP9PBD0_9BACT